LEKQERKNKEKRRTELKEAKKNDVMENYRKLSINDVIKNHDKKTPIKRYKAMFSQ